VRALAGFDPYRTQLLAVEGSGQHAGVLSPGVQDLRRGAGRARLLRGQDRQGLGAGRSAVDKRTLKPPTSGISKTDYAGNFEDFLKVKPKGKPWCFWYGSREPHRRYEYGSGVAKGHKKVSDIDKVPPYWPDSEVIRTDMLDYAFEVEYFDRHLARMLRDLEEIGELDNTLVVVTADNGMPFPRVKGDEYERSRHGAIAGTKPHRYFLLAKARPGESGA